MAQLNLSAGQNLQTAINNAQPGDVISLEAGTAWRGPIELPAKTGTGEIVLQSSRTAELPQGRIGPEHAGLMPKIICPHAEQAIRTRPGAHHWKLDGIEIVPDAAATVVYDLVRLGGSRHDQTALESVPHHLNLDRCYVHGNSSLSFQRGVTLNSSDTEITRCCISEITARGMDSQAIASWNTPGRNRIDDCYLEATGENVMFGGADPVSSDFIPSDTQILRSHLFKPLTWRGQGWTIKNLLEFKNAQRIVVNGCRLENNWGGEGQSGIGVLFTVRNQEGTAPWSIVKDIVFQNCIALNCDGGALNFLGSDNEKPSQKASDVTIRNCVFDKIRGTFLTINGFDGVTIERVTHLQQGNTILFYGSAQSQRFIYRLNVTQEREYGIRDENGSAEGAAALAKWAPGYVFTDSVMATPYTKNPEGNEYPSSLQIGVDYRTGYAGKGADIDALLAAQKTTAIVPVPQPEPTPIPIPVPEPTPVPPTVSPNGIKAITIIDAQLNVWSLGPQRQTLRNGAQVGGGAGTIYKWQDGVVWVLGMDNFWYRWQGNSWRKGTTVEPGPVTRLVAWPTQTAQQNATLDQQWSGGYRLKRIEVGNATFERVE